MNERIDISIEALKNAIENLAEKQKSIMTGWLIRWAGYIKGESTFSSSHLKAFRRGEILLVDFGFRQKVNWADIIIR